LWRDTGAEHATSNCRHLLIDLAQPCLRHTPALHTPIIATTDAHKKQGNVAPHLDSRSDEVVSVCQCHWHISPAPCTCWRVQAVEQAIRALDLEGENVLIPAPVNISVKTAEISAIRVS
jgi:hypothetical protein